MGRFGVRALIGVLGMLAAGCEPPCEIFYMGRCVSRCVPGSEYCPDGGADGGDARAGEAGGGLDADAMMPTRDDGAAEVGTGDGGLVLSELEAPRLIAPLSTATATTRQPTLRWALPAGVTGARIELCRDRAMTRECVAFDAPNASSARPSSALAPGMWFWRASGRAEQRVGRVPSAVWQVVVPPRETGRDTSFGAMLDVNGDGFTDLAVGAPGSSSRAGRVYLGANALFGTSIAVGDVNNDGAQEVVIGAPGDGMVSPRVHIVNAPIGGTGTSPATRLDAPAAGETDFGRALAM